MYRHAGDPLDALGPMGDCGLARILKPVVRAAMNS